MIDIAVVTAVHQPNFRFLPELYESLVEQVDVNWEWIVQVDGAGDPDLPQDSRIRLGHNRISGPGATRTMALALTSAPIVRTLDSDDLLLDGALARDIDVLQTHDDVGWCTSPALDLHPDGSTTRWDKDDPTPGRIPKGWIQTQWRSPDWILPVLPSTLAIRRTLLLAVGGWMSLPTSEDTGLLITANTIAAGWFHTEPGNLYRKHEGQLTRSQAHTDPEQAVRRHELIVERAEAFKDSGAWFAPSTPRGRSGSCSWC